MDAGEGLKFSCECDERSVELERRIKTEIRRHSLSVPVEREIGRYSDRCATSELLAEDFVWEVVSMELMSPEIIEAVGSNGEKSIEDIGGLESSDSGEEQCDDEAGESISIEDDYVENFYDEDDEPTVEKNEESYLI